MVLYRLEAGVALLFTTLCKSFLYDGLWIFRNDQFVSVNRFLFLNNLNWGINIFFNPLNADYLCGMTCFLCLFVIFKFQASEFILQSNCLSCSYIFCFEIYDGFFSLIMISQCCVINSSMIGEASC